MIIDESRVGYRLSPTLEFGRLSCKQSRGALYTDNPSGFLSINIEQEITIRVMEDDDKKIVQRN